MKISEILTEMTSAGAIATVAQPMGSMIKRPGPAVKKKKKKKTNEGDVVPFKSKSTKTDQEKFASAWEKQHDDEHRYGVGKIPCEYCGDEWCDFDCDESQAGGFNERKLSKAEIKKRDEYADDLPDAEFKKRYGKDWESVKYGTATNMAKKK